MESFPSLPSGWPLSTGEGGMKGTRATSRGTDDAEMGRSPGRPIHPLPGSAGGDVIWEPTSDTGMVRKQ